MNDTVPSGRELARLFYDNVVAPLLARAMPRLRYAAGRRDREGGLASACEVLLSLQRARGLPAPAAAVTAFWDRPYRTVDEAVPRALLADISDPQVARLPPGIGSIEQWAGNVDLLAHPDRRQALRTTYHGWAEGAANGRPR